MKINCPNSKMWGNNIFWGLGFDFDPQWSLTKNQIEIQNNLIKICKEVIRPNAIECDKNFTFPKKSFSALSDLRLLGLIIPKELGGLGENHTCAAMVVETISRYGCPSTAMCYVMHLAALSTLLIHSQHNPTFKALLGRINDEILIGTIAYSDPTTGSHAWYPLASKAEKTSSGWKIFKKASWVTSSGFADWYIVQTTSHDFQGDYSKLSCYLLFKNEVVSNPAAWNGLGMRGNQSGPLEVNGVEIANDRLIGQPGEAIKTNNESPDIFYLLCSSACWNGVSMGLIDLGTKHTTNKKHEDVGNRVADYPSIQDYYGEVIAETNCCRMNCFYLAETLDKKTENCNWKLYEKGNFYPKSQFMTWFWQLKFSCTKNVSYTSDKILHSCGGSAYKPEIEIERYLRDSKAGWIMAPTNEVLRQLIGKLALLGPEAIDSWNKVVNEKILKNEINKMDKLQLRQYGEYLIKKSES